jgi:hypothetical protein
VNFPPFWGGVRPKGERSGGDIKLLLSRISRYLNSAFGYRSDFQIPDQYGQESLNAILLICNCFLNYLNFRNREDGPLFCHITKQLITVCRFQAFYVKPSYSLI